jgi:N4-(beta-N-acetylglucosaminyl)-L-asparaginase
MPDPSEPQILRGQSTPMTQPIILSTWSFGVRGNAVAFPPLAHGGSSLDAVETVARTVERDPEVDSVGFGGRPDQAGRVTLDACVMLSPAQTGGVCAQTRHVNAVSIARHVMESTECVLLAGDGADAFAESQGFEQENLLADSAKTAWEQWRKNPVHTPHSKDRGYDHEQTNHDTIGVLALDARNTIAGACTTAGLAYKRPGRVGDSPIIGHGLYVDPAVGACTATGNGELIMGLCSSFLVVELMRRGASPRDAVTDAIQRFPHAYPLPDDKDEQVGLIALAKDGSFASAGLRPGFKVSITTADRHEAVPPDITLLNT